MKTLEGLTRKYERRGGRPRDPKLTKAFIDAVKMVAAAPAEGRPRRKLNHLEAALFNLAVEQPEEFAKLLGRVCFKPGDPPEPEPLVPIKIERVMVRNPNAKIVEPPPNRNGPDPEAVAARLERERLAAEAAKPPAPRYWFDEWLDKEAAGKLTAQDMMGRSLIRM
jgi:hypothetical protein